jgi:hypothetical protein
LRRGRSEAVSQTAERSGRASFRPVTHRPDNLNKNIADRSFEDKGNTAQPLCVRCAVNFYVRVHKFDAALLTQGKENLCAMTEKVQADDVQRR